MSIIFIGFLLALSFGLASTFFFLKASSMYFSYKEAVRRVTKGEVILPNWKFVLFIKGYDQYETEGMRQKRFEHQKNITKYWSLIILMLAIVGFTLATAPTMA